MRHPLLKGILYGLVIALACSTNIKAQGNNNPYIPSIVPPSPAASSILKFSDVPVSTYTGTADVSVPIYTVQAKGITVPVSLDYHTGGIKMEEESGLVGLGWALNAGGSISRTVMDKDDFNGTDYFNTTVPEILQDITMQPPQPGFQGSYSQYIYRFFCNDKVYGVSNTFDYYQALSSGNTLYDDMEADIYSYNFPGHSGKFVITRTGQVLMQKQENIHITFASTGSNFTITDDQGNVFYFNDKEYSEPGSGGAEAISTWNLSSITTQQKDVVTFNYATDNTWTQVQSDIYQISQTGCSNAGITGTQGNGTLYLNLTLQYIDFTSGRVTFSYDNTRNDLQNGKKLDTIRIYSKTTAGLQYVKEHQLFYSYFNSGQTYGTNYEYERLRLDSVREAYANTTLPPYSFGYNSGAGYNAFTAKHGFNVDHWGFCNASGNTSFIPGYIGPIAPLGMEEYYTATGANRETDSVANQVFSLQQVNYPTGGYTWFDYSPNYYDFYKSQNGPMDLPQYPTRDTTYPITVTSTGTSSGSINCMYVYPASLYQNGTIAITFRTISNDAGSATYRNHSGLVYFTFNGNTYDMSSLTFTCPANQNYCTVTPPIPLTLSATTYTWSAYIDPSVASDFNGIYVDIVWNELQINYTHNSTMVGGGMRIKDVIDYSASGVIAKERYYNYGFLQPNSQGTIINYSYGRLMSYPQYASYTPYWESGQNGQGTGNSCASLTIYGTSLNSVTSVIGGNIVGYDHVEEHIINPLAGNDIGMTVDSFFNVSDTTYTYANTRLAGTLNMGNNLNGSLLQKRVYSNVNGVYNEVSETDNFYHTTNRIPYFCPKYQYEYHPPAGNAAPGCAGDTSDVYQYQFSYYPSVKSERILLDSSKETVFDQITPSQYITTTKYYAYDNPVHYQPTRITTTDSKGYQHVNYMKYPQDYIPTGYTVTNNTILDTMIEKNMIDVPIEKSDSLYYNLLKSSGMVSGAVLSMFRLLPTTNVVVPDKTYKLTINGPVTNFTPMAISGNTVTMDSRYAQMISMDSYDAVADINQYTTTDQVPMAFIWDYYNTYPIAQVKHATASQVAYTSFEADGKGNWAFSGTPGLDNSAPTGYMAYNLTGGNITNTTLSSSTTYIVSYWSKSGSSYTVSGSTGVTQGKTINGWTYFEHTVTGVTTETISGSNEIDELRLYPSIAQMTTYTYTPLVGMTSQCDLNNRILYYEYDGFGRLVVVMDQDKNVIKKMCYSYNGQSAPCQEPVPPGPPMISITCDNESGYATYFQQYTNTSTLQVYTFPVPGAYGVSTIGSLPAGTYNIYMSSTPPVSGSIFRAACNTLMGSGSSATFNNVVISATTCNSTFISSP